jgi:flagellar motor switch protein FliM
VRELSKEELEELKSAVLRHEIRMDSASPSSSQERPEGLRLLVRDVVQKWSTRQLSGLEVALKKLGDSLEQSFLALSRKDCRVQFGGLSVSSLKESAFTLPEGFYSILFSLDPIVGKSALIMDPWFAFFLIYSVLAGDPPEGVDRQINELEGEMLYRTLVARVEESLLSGFEGFLPLIPKAAGFKTRPQELYISGPKESVAVALYTVLVKLQEEEKKCELRFILPLRPFEGMRQLLSSPYHGDRDVHVKKMLEKELSKVEVELKAELSRLSLTLDDLLKLTEGSLLPLGRASDDFRAFFTIEGVKKFEGTLGKKRRMKALHIQRSIME